MATKVRRRSQRRPISSKQLALEAIRKLPENASLSDIADEIAMLNGIEEGLKDADAGRVISHEEMKRRMKQWLSK